MAPPRVADQIRKGVRESTRQRPSFSGRSRLGRDWSNALEGEKAGFGVASTFGERSCRRYDLMKPVDSLIDPMQVIGRVQLTCMYMICTYVPTYTCRPQHESLPPALGPCIRSEW